MQQDTNGFKLIQEILRLLAEDNDEISVEEAKEKQSYSIADSYASAEASSYVAAESVPSFSTYTGNNFKINKIMIVADFRNTIEIQALCTYRYVFQT